jgi:molybdate transport system ATP-binding protein
VSIARAVLAASRLLLMDEPLSSLDGARKAELLPYLERMRDEAAVPILYVSHAVDEVARLATRLVVLDGGRVVATGETMELFARLDVPASLGEDAGAVLEARVTSHDDADGLTLLSVGEASLWVGRIPKPPGALVRVRILARDVSVARDAPSRSSILNVLAARIDDLRDDGPDRVRIRLVVGGDERIPPPALLARITRRSRDALGLAPGVTVYAMVKSVALVI